MKFKSIEITGLKCYNDTTRFQLNGGEGGNFVIEGHNGAGKTTIADAITFALFGCMSNGEKKITNAISNDREGIDVKLAFNHNLQDFEVRRTLGRTSTGELLLNGRPCKQDAINAMFGDQKLFLSIFFPLFFHQELTDADRRDMVIKYMPPVDYVSLWTECGLEAAWIEQYGINFANTDESSKIKKSKDSYEAMSIEKKSELNTLITMPDYNYDPASLIDTPLHPHESFATVEQELQAIKAEIMEHNIALSAKTMIEESIAELEKGLPNPSISIDDLRRLAAQDVDQYIRKRDSITIQPEIVIEENCPTCGAEINQEKIDIMHAKNIEIAESNRASIQAKTELDKIIQSIQLATQCLGTKHKYDEKCRALEATKAKIIPEDQILAKNESVIAKQQQLTEMHEHNSAAMIRNQQNAKMRSDSAQTGLRKASVKSEIERIEKEISILSSIYDALKGSGTIKQRVKQIHAEAFASSLQNCTVMLERELKNGKTEEIFEILYNNVPLRRLSFAEKVKCSIEVGNFLSRQTGFEPPIFIDCAESINNPQSLIPAGRQWFAAKVLELDAVVA